MFSGTTIIEGVECDVVFRPATLGERIRALRILKGWTPTEFARKLQVTPVCITNWELGYCRPDKTSRDSICNVLEVKLEDVFYTDEVDVKRTAILAYIAEAGFNVAKLAQKFGVNASTLTYWINTRSWPRSEEHRVMLREFFGDKFRELFDVVDEV